MTKKQIADKLSDILDGYGDYLMEMAINEGEFEDLKEDESGNYIYEADDSTAERMKKWMKKKGDVFDVVKELMKYFEENMTKNAKDADKAEIKLSEQENICREDLCKECFAPYQEMQLNTESSFEGDPKAEYYHIISDKIINALVGRILQIFETQDISKRQHEAIRGLIINEINTIRNEHSWHLNDEVLNMMISDGFPFSSPYYG